MWKDVLLTETSKAYVAILLNTNTPNSNQNSDKPIMIRHDYLRMHKGNQASILNDRFEMQSNRKQRSMLVRWALRDLLVVLHFACSTCVNITMEPKTYCLVEIISSLKFAFILTDYSHYRKEKKPNEQLPASSKFLSFRCVEIWVI